MRTDRPTQPDNFLSEATTLWSFPERGAWATHRSDYRGNFAPQIARNIIEMYSEPDELVLDPMVGSGTTLIEAKLLHRDGIGFDINPSAVELTRQSLKFDFETNNRQKVQVGDARKLKGVGNETVDLILTHPPYLDIITYSDGKIPEDLSNISDIDKFCDEIELVALELFRVLKPNRHCAILIGDTRKGKHYVPLSYYVMQRFLSVGFALKEEIIKAQHNCSHTRRWESRARAMKFYLIAHEHLFVFRKPAHGEKTSKIKYSLKR